MGTLRKIISTKLEIIKQGIFTPYE